MLPVACALLSANCRRTGIAKIGRLLYNAAMGLDYRNLSRDEMIQLLESRERALREASEIYLKAFRASPDSITVTDAETGKILDVNGGFEQLFGYERNEVIGHSSLEFGFWGVPEDRIRMVELLKQHGSLRNFQTLGKTRQGEERICLLSAESMEIAGRPSIVLIVRDITDQKEAEKALRASEEALRATIENTPHVAVQWYDADSRIVFWNKASENTYGWTAAEAIGKKLSDLIFTPAEQNFFEEAIQQIVRTDQPFGPMEFPYRGRNGKTGFVLSTIFRLTGTGSEARFVCMDVDVTERKRVEEALRENQRVLATLLSNLPGMVYRCKNDLDWTMEFVSEGCRELTGYAPEDLLQNRKTSYGKITHADDQILVWDAIQTALNERRTFELTYRILTIEGMEKWVWERGQGIFSEQGELIALEGFITDITARRRAELERARLLIREQQAREEYTRQLIQAQETERTRIARELHDSLGQNLLLIKNRAQLAFLNESSPANVHEQLENISLIASESIAEVRAISRDLHPYQLDHLGLTRSLEAMIDAATEASHVQFKRKIDMVDDIFTNESALNLYRAVQESLSNIIKHSRAQNASIELERDVREVELRIHDNGAGFLPAIVNDGSKNLGLKNIAERVRILGGTLSINSSPENGTHIDIVLPIPAQHV